MDVSYLCIDAELENLFNRFGKQHPEGSKEVLKVVLKTYLKLVETSRKRGTDPLLSLQDLVERITSGDMYRSTKDKINSLDSMLEAKEDQSSHLEGSALFEEIREIKNTMRKMQWSQGPSGPAQGSSQGSAEGSLSDFNPKDAAKLITIEESSEIKKGANYMEIRKKGKPPKKIVF
ncbi:hypothetical protein WDW37_15115 [Bdellovibrionota bacterium FG-1]